MEVLVIAPHPDDEVLGCGGTIAKYAAEGHEVYVCIVTKGCEPLFPERDVEKTREECKMADHLLGVKKTVFLDFPAAMLEDVRRYELNGAILDAVMDIKPEIVFLPHRGDMQLDHKLIVDASMVALRPKYTHTVKKILSYETMSETGWDVPNCVNEFIPTAYSDITKYIDRKLEALRIFKSQMTGYPGARSEEAVMALAMYRGASMNMRYAEAFSVIRDVF